MAGILCGSASIAIFTEESKSGAPGPFYNPTKVAGSDTQARLEHDYEDLRRKALQKDLFSGKLKPDDVKKMGYTDEQIREIVSGRRLIPGESWGDFSGMGLPKIKIVGKGELSDDEVNRIATERKKRGEALRHGIRRGLSFMTLPSRRGRTLHAKTE